MRPMSSLGIGLSLVSGCLLLALAAELYYLLWWKKRAPNSDTDEGYTYSSPGRELLYLFCWKKPSSLSSAALNPQEICTSANTTDGSDNALQSSSGKDLLIPFGGEDSMEAELMRLHSLSGPPRFLFTIKEETKEDLESEDGRSRGGRSRRGSRGKSLSDFLLPSETPFMTPLSSPPFFTPPLTPLNCHGFNPLFESSKSDRSSPPPKFKFLRDAEEKLYKKTLTDEAMRVHMNAGSATTTSTRGPEEEEGSFITIIIGKNREKGNHPGSSQVNPLPSSPSAIRPSHGKLGSYLASKD